MRYHNSGSHELLGELGSKPSNSFDVNRLGFRRMKSSVSLVAYEVEVVHSDQSRRHRAIY
jgi:hypothetical protein